jgi:hypothetical protein
MNNHVNVIKNNKLNFSPGYHPLLRTLELTKKVNRLKMMLIKDNNRLVDSKLNEKVLGSYISCRQEQEKTRSIYDRITVSDLQQSNRYNHLIPVIETVHETLEVCEYNILHHVALEKTSSMLSLVSERLSAILPDVSMN